eukprot:3940599-Rhodomonas_salina.2
MSGTGIGSVLCAVRYRHRVRAGGEGESWRALYQQPGGIRYAAMRCSVLPERISTVLSGTKAYEVGPCYAMLSTAIAKSALCYVRCWHSVSVRCDVHWHSVTVLVPD